MAKRIQAHMAKSSKTHKAKSTQVRMAQTRKAGNNSAPISDKDHKRFMQMAVDLSEQALDAGKGGPFGAIIVSKGRIVGSSGNCVFKHTDPTAHAEIMAIRDACENLGTDDLSGCEIYSSGEPCPMCMAAIYWARIDGVYFSNTEKEALKHGFVDKLILAELRKAPSKRKIQSVRIQNPAAIAVFKKASAMGFPKKKTIK